MAGNLMGASLAATRKDMLNFITWTGFITATVILTAAYYARMLSAHYGIGIMDRLRSKRTGRARRYTSHAPSSEGQIGQIPEGSSELLSQLRIYLAADRRSRAEWDGVALGEPLTRKQGGELLRERFLVQGLEPPDSSQLDELWGRCYP